MPKTKSEKLNKKAVSVVAGAVVSLTALLVTFGQSIGINVPNWNDLGQAVQIYDSVEGDFFVHYLDVGKADAIYINCGDKNMVIDAGEDTTSRQLNKYIQRLGVNSLDLVIATHPDKDHIGGMANIIEDFKINEFWEPKLGADVTPDTKVYSRMQKALEDKKVSVKNPSQGDSVKLGDMTIDVLSPDREYNNTNDSSIVVKITYGKTKFLFMGDASTKVEKNLIKSKIDLNAAVIKLGHHGSKTASSNDFLSKVNPQIAIISVGPDQNNLPDEEVLNRLKELTIPFYRTDEYGTVVVSSNGNEISVSTQK